MRTVLRTIAAAGLVLAVLSVSVGVPARVATAQESVPPADQSPPEMTSLFVTSFDGTRIDVNVCRPGNASAENPVPIVLESHGWTGQKSSCLGRTTFFNAGIGVASMTQRGNGESTGRNNVMDPNLEGRDIMAVIDHLASLDWVLKDDGPGGTDPVLGGLGGSYGGGFQWIGAFSDQYFRDAPTRFNSLHPGNTWYDLRTALAPNGVLRTVMAGGLYAAGAQNNDLAPWIHAAMGTILATGQVIDGPRPANFGSEMHQHSAAWFVEQGERLDIPVLIQQGAGDLVFNLNEGIDAFQQALTPEARARSLFVNHQAGHGIPERVPGVPAIPFPAGPVPATARSEATCPAVGPLAWFEHTLLGEPLDLGARLRLRTVDGRCLSLDEFPSTSETPVEALSQTVLPTGPRGPTRFFPISQGPLTLAGAPTLSLTATTTVPDARRFWGLAVGTGPDDAELLGGQWMPIRIAEPALERDITTELGGVVADVPEGQTLYLVTSPYADQFAAHSSRTPGVIVVDDVKVGLPIVQEAPENNAPVAAFSYAPSSPRPTETVTFDASSSADPDLDDLTYRWDLGDGTSAEGRVVTHEYAEVGDYEVSLTVADGTEEVTATQTVSAVPNQAPSATASSETERPRRGEAAAFDGSDSVDPDGDALTYTWDMGDGTTVTGEGISHSYQRSGRYDVTLRVEDGFGGIDSDSFEVIVRGGGGQDPGRDNRQL